MFSVVLESAGKSKLDRISELCHLKPNMKIQTQLRTQASQEAGLYVNSGIRPPVVQTPRQGRWGAPSLLMIAASFLGTKNSALSASRILILNLPRRSMKSQAFSTPGPRGSLGRKTNKHRVFLIKQKRTWDGSKVH